MECDCDEIVFGDIDKPIKPSGGIKFSKVSADKHRQGSNVRDHLNLFARKSRRRWGENNRRIQSRKEEFLSQVTIIHIYIEHTTSKSCNSVYFYHLLFFCYW